MTPRKLLLLRWLIPVVAVLPGAFACADNCLQIQNLLCNCYGKTTNEISSCETNASTQESINPPTAQQNVVCGQLLPGCMDAISSAGGGNPGDNCPVLQTLQGRQACGLSAQDVQNPTADAGIFYVDGGTPVADAGPADAGAPVDAGSVDAGVVPDAGPAADAGPAPDAGVDAGPGADAGP